MAELKMLLCTVNMVAVFMVIGNFFFFDSNFSYASGVKAFEKREGGGSHNWGKPTEEVEATE